MTAPVQSSPGPTFHTATVDEVLDSLATTRERGLTSEDARRRLADSGENRLAEAKTPSWWAVLIAQFKDLVIVLLAVAAGLAFATGRLPEAIAVCVVILVNAAIGFVSEWRAVRSMEALRGLSDSDARVIRDGEERSIPVTQLVAGDVIQMRAGDLVAADVRILTAQALRVNEAALTGESVPVDKTADQAPADAPLAERTCMAFKGTSVAAGTGQAVVVATGQATELGRIAELASSASPTVAPLQRRLNQLGARLAWLTLAIAAAVALLGLWLRKGDGQSVLETALALGIAAIPEGLPIVATTALARGMYLMAKRNALVNRLAAVEALGATRVIFSDKTGTLTENKMRLSVLHTAHGDVELDDEQGGELSDSARQALVLATLCNGADLDAARDGGSEDDPNGDPTEIAILAAAREHGLNRADLLQTTPEVRVEEFDPDEKKMATYHRDGDTVWVAVKGAPAEVLRASVEVVNGDGEVEALTDPLRERWQERAEALAGRGLRVLAVAEKRVSSEDAAPYEELRLLGMLGLLDPPRTEVKVSIDRCQAAGIQVKMVTGDQPATAQAIAHAVGIVGDEDDPEAHVLHGSELQPGEGTATEDILRANIFARVSPEQKLRLVEAYQDAGEIVAMTGDGVNDAPAMKKADVGIAMGRRGTQAAKQVADVVLQDDAFESIVVAVEQGRVIFANIRKAVMFMLVTNVAEVLAVTVATVAGWTLPLLPLQILYLNILTDVFPALALGVGPASGTEMDGPPRPPSEPVLTRGRWMQIFAFAGLMAVCVLAALWYGESRLQLPTDQAVTLSFLTLAFGKLLFVLNLRDRGTGVFRNEITRNGFMAGAVVLCGALLLAAVYVPGLSTLLSTSPPTQSGWAVIAAGAVLPWLLGQVWLSLPRKETSARAKTS